MERVFESLFGTLVESALRGAALILIALFCNFISQTARFGVASRSLASGFYGISASPGSRLPVAAHPDS